MKTKPITKPIPQIKVQIGPGPSYPKELADNTNQRIIDKNQAIRKQNAKKS